MGNKNLEASTEKFKTELKNNKEDSYRIVVYQANLLPKDLHPLILGPFLTKLRYGNDFFKLIDKDVYFSTYTKVINGLLSKPECKVKLAMSWDEKEQIDVALGWCLYEERKVHFVFVKEEVQRLGIARSLCPKEIDVITHITKKALNIWHNKIPQARFNPFI